MQLAISSPFNKNQIAENFNNYRGKIKGDTLKGFDPYSLKDLEISSEGTRPNTRYGIRMDEGKIEIVY